jgi:hypothetical protein
MSTFIITLEDNAEGGVAMKSTRITPPGADDNSPALALGNFFMVVLDNHAEQFNLKGKRQPAVTLPAPLH